MEPTEMPERKLVRTFAIRGACVLLVSIAAQLAHGEGRLPTDNVGRYQLFQGEYRFINLKGEEHWIRALFKVDTATGKLFICEGEQTDGKLENKGASMIQRQYCHPFENEIVVPKR